MSRVQNKEKLINNIININNIIKCLTVTNAKIK